MTLYIIIKTYFSQVSKGWVQTIELAWQSKKTGLWFESYPGFTFPHTKKCLSKGIFPDFYIGSHTKTCLELWIGRRLLKN
ncbi:hypothetical protein A2Y26_01615 [candidate division CPR2 bacterium GWD2_39_7]|nr:MAG: hypothetical protein A2Y27_00700 [candidate division CPR2 bacterium GWD1_39_7]OGB71520.1 MAG: hypothetical protein A2Y26_01615 [candidate division CPR2 bacterium GWD2_39_7]